MASCTRIKCIFLTFILSILFSSSFAQTENTTRPEVTISQGTIQGTTFLTRNGRSISAFLGIPYAEPPIGNLRFANPVAAKGWNGTRDGSVDGSLCNQDRYNVVFGDEDCLNLNVYTPQLPENGSSTLLPTMFYIYGGAFLFGRGGSTAVHPANLLDKDVLLVVPNYRMGPFGFLSTGDEVASGNYGLKDVVLALQWVQDNIEYFGGDPNRVTLFGSSSGSVSTHLLTLANATEGLFHRFITQSGSAVALWASRPRAAYANLAYRLGSYVGCNNDTSDALVECLRTVDALDIVATYDNFYVWESYPLDPWGPTDEPDIEGALLVGTPRDLYAAGKIRDIPWIIGLCRDEGALDTARFYANEELFEDFIENFDLVVPVMESWTYLPDKGESWLAAIKAYYFNNDVSSMNKSELLANLTVFISDSHFFYPGYSSLQQHHRIAENPQYLYNFTYRGNYSVTVGATGSTEDYGVAHADDIIYLFPCHLIFTPCLGTLMSETDEQMIDIMTEMWTNFAATGVPTTPDGTPWDPFSSDENYLRIGNHSGVELAAQNFSIQQRMEFWANLYASLEDSTTASDTSGAVILIPSLLCKLSFTLVLFFHTTYTR